MLVWPACPPRAIRLVAARASPARAAGYGAAPRRSRDEHGNSSSRRAADCLGLGCRRRSCRPPCCRRAAWLIAVPQAARGCAPSGAAGEVTGLGNEAVVLLAPEDFQRVSCHWLPEVPNADLNHWAVFTRAGFFSSWPAPQRASTQFYLEPCHLAQDIDVASSRQAREVPYWRWSSEGFRGQILCVAQTTNREPPRRADPAARKNRFRHRDGRVAA